MTSTLSTMNAPAGAYMSRFGGLLREVKDQGLLQRRPVYYVLQIGIHVGLFIAIWAGFFALGNSWFQLILAIQMAVFGLCLGASFAPGHKGMPLILRRQVMVSRNVRGNPVLDCAMGGLDYQIEHHLFPSMPRCNLRRARPIVRAHCEREGVAYVEVGLIESYAIVVDYLNNVGLRARDPFDCPLAAQLRDGLPPSTVVRSS